MRKNIAVARVVQVVQLEAVRRVARARSAIRRWSPHPPRTHGYINCAKALVGNAAIGVRKKNVGFCNKFLQYCGGAGDGDADGTEDKDGNDEEIDGETEGEEIEDRDDNRDDTSGSDDDNECDGKDGDTDGTEDGTKLYDEKEEVDAADGVAGRAALHGPARAVLPAKASTV